MYHPELKTKANGFPVITNDEIDVLGERLVGDFSPLSTLVPQEIDIDRFVSKYMKMTQDFHYLSHCGIYLGMTVFQNTDYLPVYDQELNSAKFVHADAGTIIIDNTLLSETQEHRYRFTMGHEAGHAILHTSYFLNKIGVEDEKPYVQCRADYYSAIGAVETHFWSDAQRAEQQANRLSAAILMPKSAVKILLARTPNRGQRNWIEKAVQKLVETFNISPEAAFYRLKALDYINGDLQYFR